MVTTGEALAVAEGATPIRTCIGCRATAAQSRLLRFRRRDDGVVVAANVTRGPATPGGRTTYLCPRRGCLDQAIKRRAFARAFASGRQRVSVIDVDADALWTAIAEQLRREIDLLGRTSENPHAHPRRRGLEQLLSELSSSPQTPPVRRSSKRGPKQPEVDRTNDEPQEGGAPHHG